MCRRYRRTIVWVLVAAMCYSPSIVFAQQTATSESVAGESKAKIDVSFISPSAAAAVVLYPRHVLTAPSMEMLPTEVITAAGKKFLGIDPLEVEQVVAMVEAPQQPPQGPPRLAIVLHTAKAMGDEKVLPELWQMTSEGQIDGKTYRKAMNPMLPSIFRPDDRTLIVATDSLLQELWSNRANPKEGAVSKALGRIKEPSDALALLMVEPIRPLVAMPLAMAPVPPPLADVKKLPDLVTSIGAKVNLTGDMAMSLTVKANDEAAAEQIEQIIDKLLDVARQQASQESAKQMASSDPVEQAMGQYSKRLSERMLQAVRPVRKGKTLTLASDAGKNPQMVQVATIGILIALLLPAVQAAREAARRVASTNNLKLIGLAMHNYAQANKTFPPAYKADASGKPLLSWRVLILPFVCDDGLALYNQFHLDEPWDSDNNKALIARMPAVYRDPNSTVADQGKTNYLTVRNEKSVFPGGKGVGFAEITDGTSNTIMTVEVPDENAVIWTKPDDFAYDEDNPLKGLVGMRPGVFLAGFADGSVRAINTTIDQTVLKALFTRNGGEQVSPP